MKIKPHLRVVRIDPLARTVTNVPLPWKRDYVSNLYAMTGAKQLGHFELTKIEERRLIVVVDGFNQDGGGTPLLICAEADTEVAKTHPGWKLRDFDTKTAGGSVLFGKGERGMIDCPVDAAWVLERIEWLTVEETFDEEEG